MGTRPRTKLVKARKDRRCSKCGAKLNSQRKRCKKCASPQAIPGLR
jgi:predicted amidophosphoribosyltransferase